MKLLRNILWKEKEKEKGEEEEKEKEKPHLIIIGPEESTKGFCAKFLFCTEMRRVSPSRFLLCSVLMFSVRVVIHVQEEGTMLSWGIYWGTPLCKTNHMYLKENPENNVR